MFGELGGRTGDTSYFTQVSELPLTNSWYLTHVEVKSLIKKGAVDGPFSILAKGLMVNDG